MDDAEGDRRARVPRARARATAAASRVDPQRLVPRHARGRDRGRQRGHDRPGRRATTRETPGLSGVAPRAWLGNYRVFNVPTPIGTSRTRRRSSPRSSRRSRDGMDVINFSGGGPQTEPANDAMIETVANVAAAGVVPVISAGNDRDDFGSARPGSPGTAPEAISVAAVSNTQVFAPVARASSAPVRARRPGSRSVRTRGRRDAGRRGRTPTSRSSTSARSSAPTDAGAPHLCGPPGNPNGGADSLPAGSLDRRDRARLARHLHLRVEGRARARRRRASGSSSSTTAPARRTASRSQLALPGGMIADLDGAALARYLAAHGGRTRVRIGRDAAGARRPAAAASSRASRPAGPTAFGHLLKPDVAAPGGADPLRDAAAAPAARSPSSTGRAWRRRTSPAPPRSCSSAIRAGRRARSSRRSSRRPAPPGPTPRARSRRR